MDFSTSPFDSTRGIRRVTSSPWAEFDLHRSLWVDVSERSASQCTDNSSINVPSDGFRGPIDDVSVELSYRISDSRVCSVNVDVLVSLGKDVCLDISWLVPNEFDINFVQIVALEHQGADNTSTRTSFHNDFGSAPKDVKLRLKGWRVALHLNSHVHSIAFVCDSGGRGDNIEFRSLAFTKVPGEGTTKSRIVLEASFERVAIRGGLRQSRWQQSRSYQDEASNQHFDIRSAFA